MTKVGMPESWVHAPLGGLGVWRGGGTPSMAEPRYWKNGTIPWVSAKDMKVNVIKDSQDHITALGLEESTANLIPQGALLFVTRSGILRHTLPVATTARPVAINQDIKALIPSEGINPEYLRYAIESMAHQILHECSKDGTTVQSIDLEKLKAIQIPIAPIEEQARIVKTLQNLLLRVSDSENEMLAAYQRAPIFVDSSKQWLFGHVKPGEKIRGSLDIPNFFLLPPGWRWSKVSSVAEVSGGITKNKKRSASFALHPYLRVANVYADQLKLDDIQKIGVSESELSRVSLRAGDLLFVEGNGSVDQIGRVAQWNGEIPDCVHQNHLIKVRFSDQRLARVVLHWCQTVLGRMAIVEVASSTSGLHTLSISKIENLIVPIPPEEILESLVDSLDSISTSALDLISRVDAAAQLTEELRQSILVAAFRGKLVPQDPRDDSAERLLARVRTEQEANATLARRRRKAA